MSKNEKVVAFIWLRERYEREKRPRYREHLLDELTELWKDLNRIERLIVRKFVPEGMPI